MKEEEAWLPTGGGAARTKTRKRDRRKGEEEEEEEERRVRAHHGALELVELGEPRPEGRRSRVGVVPLVHLLKDVVVW